MYHEINKIKDEEYHYLVENIRVGKNKWKKIKIYLGKGKKTKKEINDLIRRNSKALKDKVNEYLTASDPLFGLIKEKQIAELENIRKYNIKKIRKMGKIEWEKYYEWFVTQFTYDTNAIEGSTLSLIDTKLILFEDTVPKGKRLREINEAANHKEAFDYMLDYKGELTRKFILELHKKLMYNILWKYAGVFRDVQVYIRGAEIMPQKPKYIEKKFNSLMRWYASNKKKYHPIVIASYFHSVFESIHPFRDGNGRIGRLVLNFILKKNGFPMVDIKNKDKKRYYEALQKADNGNLRPFVNMIIKYLKEMA
jgi:Fic family protein